MLIQVDLRQVVYALSDALDLVEHCKALKAWLSGTG